MSVNSILYPSIFEFLYQECITQDLLIDQELPMEDICKDIRSFINQFQPGYYDGQFVMVFPERQLTSTLTPAEMLRLLARIQTFSGNLRHRLDLNGYIVAVQELRNDERNEKLHNELSEVKLLNVAESASIVAPEAELFKNVAIRSVVQKIPVSETERHLFNEWCAKNKELVYNAIFQGKTPERMHNKTVVYMAYFVKYKMYDMLDIAKRMHEGWYSGVWQYLMGNGDLDMLKWLINDGCILHNRELFRLAAGAGHINIM